MSSLFPTFTVNAHISPVEFSQPFLCSDNLWPQVISSISSECEVTPGDYQAILNPDIWKGDPELRLGWVNVLKRYLVTMWDRVTELKVMCSAVFFFFSDFNLFSRKCLRETFGNWGSVKLDEEHCQLTLSVQMPLYSTKSWDDFNMTLLLGNLLYLLEKGLEVSAQFQSSLSEFRMKYV